MRFWKRSISTKLILSLLLLSILPALFVGYFISKAFAPLPSLCYTVILILVGAVIAIIGLGFLLSIGITKPIRNLTREVAIIGRGDLSYRIKVESEDELGRLADALNRMADDLDRFIKREKKSVATIAVEAERKRAMELGKAYRKLQKMQDMLVQAEKMNAVGQLASGVAHEVRNPLGIIIQGVNYLENKIPKEAGIDETLSIIKASVKRADKIINSLFDFSKAARLDLHPEDINSILDSSLTLVKTKFKFKNIDIVKETKQDLPKVSVDKTRIEQVFVNIFLNAIQSMPKGGKIIIRSFDKQLKGIKNGIGKRSGDYFRAGERAVIVEIEDTGAGISEEDLNRAFDPFFTTKGPRAGAGLGLAVSRSIINMHRGLIDITSQISKGTKVIIALKILGR